MTTSEALDLLSQLNVGAIKEAAQLKDRPQDRFGATHFRADILGSGADLQVVTRRPEKSNFDQQGVWLTIDVKEILAGRGELGEQQLWIRMARTRQDGTNPAEDNSEYSRMLLAANESDASVTNLRQLPGRKNVEFKDESYKYMGRTQQNGEWMDREFTTWFYRLNFRTTVANGSPAAVSGSTPAQPGAAAIERALAIVKDAGESGIKEAEFNMAISKESAKGRGDALSPVYLSEGRFVADNKEVLRDGDTLVWVAGE